MLGFIDLFCMHRCRSKALWCIAVSLALVSLELCSGRANAFVYVDNLKKRFYPESELDLEKYGFRGSADLLGIGDTLGCREKIAEYFLHRKPRGGIEQWGTYDDAIYRADEFLKNRYILGEYKAYSLPPKLTWKENPSKLMNWGFLFLAFDIFRSANEAYRVTGNERYIVKCKELIGGFTEDNYNLRKHPSEFSWYDHSVALRAIYSIDFWHQYLRSSDEDRTFTLLFMELIWRHAKYLANDRHYSKKTNHGIYSNIALLRIALAFPEFRDSEEWIKLSLSRMEQQVRENFSTEGVHKEYSPVYHILTAKLLCRFCRDCRGCRTIKLSRDFTSKLAKIKMNIPYFFHPDGMLSLIGDSQLFSAETLLKPLAAINPCIRYVQTSGKEGRAPRMESKAFNDAQMFIMRSGWGRVRPLEEECYLIADFTPYGNAHQHFDFMTFELCARGFRWITDLGSLTYNKHDPRRRYIVSGPAHNIVVPYRMRQEKAKKRKTAASNKKSKRELNRISSRLKRRINEINKMENIEQKISAYEDLLNEDLGEMEDMILILLALGYDESKTNQQRATSCLEKVVKKGARSKYSQVAREMLAVQEIKPEDKKLESEKPEKEKTRSRIKRIGAGKPKNPKAERSKKPYIRNRTAGSLKKKKASAYPSSSLKPVAAFRNRKPIVDFWISEPAFDYLEGRFQYQWFFEHARAILFIKPYCFLIVDRMYTKNQCTLKQLFHMPPAVKVSKRSDGFLLSAMDSMRCLVLCLSRPADSKSDVLKGVKQKEIQGWYSGIFGNFEEAPVLECSFTTEEGTYFTAHLFVPAGKDDISDYNVEIKNGDRWDPNCKEPLSLTINEPGYHTNVTFRPSSTFFLSMKAVEARAPRVEISRRRTTGRAFH